MSSQQYRIGLVALTLVAVLVFAAALPAVNALTPSTVYGRYQQKTDRFPGGQHICGESLCSPDQWAKMKNFLHVAQRDPNECTQLRAWIPCNQQATSLNTSTK